MENANVPYKLLVVDDSPKNIQVLGSILREEHMQVGVAMSGTKALELLQRADDYDLILLDINMPGLDGIETCLKLKADKRLADIPVIFLTAYTDTEHIVEGFKAGAVDYVTKPFRAEELLSRVRTHVELRRARRELEMMNVWLEEKVAERTVELREANQQLERANRELQNLDRHKSEFLQLLSHEIRTPLNGIMGFAFLLSEDLAETSYREYLDHLNSSISRLEKFAVTALHITQLNVKGPELSFNPVYADEMIADALSAYNTQISAKNISVNTCGDALETAFLADRKLLQMALNGVVDNAVRFSPPEGHITLSADITDGMITMACTDEGPGFSEQSLLTLFKPFSSPDHTDGYVGLDLALAKYVMEAHRGSIKVVNTPGGGAGVILSIPLSA